MEYTSYTTLLINNSLVLIFYLFTDLFVADYNDQVLLPCRFFSWSHLHYYFKIV